MLSPAKLRDRRLKTVASERVKPASVIAADAAVTLAALTALVYATAFSFEVGYCRYFSIPISLIVPTTSVILTALIAVVLTVLTLAPLLGIVRLVLREASLPPRFRFNIELTFLAALSGLGVFGFSWSALASTVFAAFMFCGVYIVALFSRRGSLMDRIRRVDGEPDHLVEASPLIGLFQSIGAHATLFVMFTLFMFAAANAVGAASARLQKDFDVMVARPDVALLRSYGDLMVGIKFDDRKRAATGEVILFKIDQDLKQVNLLSRRIGPLAGRDRKFLDLGDSDTGTR